MGGRGQGGWERRSEAFVKIQKFFFFFFFFFLGGGGSGQGGGRLEGFRVGGVQGGWERRSEACVKIQKIKWGGGGRAGVGVRVEVNGEVKLL